MAAAAGSLLTISGGFSIALGVIVAVMGLVLIGLLIFGGGVPIGAAGLFGLFTMVGGPCLLVAGTAVIWSGVKLMGGHSWARTLLEVFAWLVITGTVCCLAYFGITARKIEGSDVVSGMIYFLATCVPSIALLLLLWSEAVRSAMTR